MKKIFVNRKGKVILKDVREPFIETKGLLVKIRYGLISSGTELATIQSAKLTNFTLKGILINFLKSKDYRKRFYEEIKGKNLKNVFYLYKMFSSKDGNKNFESPSINLIPLGYSSSGIIQKSNIEKYEENDRVACAGSSHAELIYSSKNLSCKIPDNVSLVEASFTTLGAIALHGIHRANVMAGEYIGIIGTGLVGLLAVQLAKINGANVVAFDLMNNRLNLAKKLGADLIINPMYHNSMIKVKELTNGHGLDSIIICASSKSPKPLDDAVNLVRDRGKIIMVGGFPINVDRSILYYKEVDLLISRSYGPGRYDESYEYDGNSYPKEYIPWTEHENMKIILNLMSEKKIDVKSMISDIIPAENAYIAYNKLINDPVNTLAILLDFSGNKSELIISKKKEKNKQTQKILNIGLIGCGAFAQFAHIPHLLSNKHCKIKAISTQHTKTASFCEKNYHPDYVSTNHKKILKDPDIDTVFIYTRHNSHADLSIEALKAGKNVFVEKPMGLTLEQCKNVYNTIKETNKSYMIGFNRRYSPFIIKAKELLTERKNPIIINYRIANPYIPGNHWVFDPDIGGGPLIGELCHFTDIILHLMNSMPIELIAKGGNLSHKELDVYDSCSVIIKFQDGSIANITYNDLNGLEIPKERIEIFSGDSAIIIDDFIKMNTSGFDSGNQILYEQDKGHKKEMLNVIRSNLNLEKQRINEKNAFNAMILCFKIIESIKNDECVFLKGDFLE